jgi:hypothetical protein
MPTHDIVARIGAVISILAALWNIVLSAVWVAFFIWFLVGVLWFIPMALAVVQIIGSIAILVVGQHKATPAVPALGLLVSLCNFNMIAGMMELIALGCQGGAWYLASQEEQNNDNDVIDAEPALAA